MEKGNQHVRNGSAYVCMCFGIRWVGRCLAYVRQPARIADCFRIVVSIASTNGGHRSPQIVRVFGVVKGDYLVRKTQVKQSEQAGILRGRQTVRYGRRLGNFIPIVLNSSVPKAPDQYLIRR